MITLGVFTDADTSGAQEFSRIVGVIADQERNIYVADQRTLNIRVFDERGRLLRTIGREGSA